MEDVETICVHLTGRCNLNCHHCFHRFPDASLNPQRLIEFVSEFSKRGLKHVSLSGGEPTLHNDVVSVVKQLSAIVDVTLTTNGTLSIAQLINLDCPSLSFRVSLDGPKGVHECNRGVGSFSPTITTIKELVATHRSVGINTVLTHELLPHLKSFSAFLDEIGVNSWALLTLREQKNIGIAANLSKESILNMTSSFSRRVDFWDYAGSENNYLLLREDGQVLLPGLSMASDIILGHINTIDIAKMLCAIKAMNIKEPHFKKK